MTKKNELIAQGLDHMAEALRSFAEAYRHADDLPDLVQSRLGAHEGFDATAKPVEPVKEPEAVAEEPKKEEAPAEEPREEKADPVQMANKAKDILSAHMKTDKEKCRSLITKYGKSVSEILRNTPEQIAFLLDDVMKEFGGV